MNGISRRPWAPWPLPTFGNFWLALLPVVWVVSLSLGFANFSPKNVAGSFLFMGFAALVFWRPWIGMATLLGLVGAKHLITAMMPAMERPFLPLVLTVLAAATFDRLRRGRLVLCFGTGFCLVGLFAILALWSQTQVASLNAYRDYDRRPLPRAFCYSCSSHTRTRIVAGSSSSARASRPGP